MSFKLSGALLAVIAGLGLLIVQQPSLEDRVLRSGPQLNAVLDARKVQIDPAELLTIMNTSGSALNIIDVRNENDFNLFHIVDSQPVTMEQIRDSTWVKTLPAQTIFVLVSNDEKRATEAWKLLTVQKVKNLYLLEGGINYWIALYDPEHVRDFTQSDVKPGPGGDDMPRYTFVAALGSRHPASDPDPEHVPQRKYTQKVKSFSKKTRKSGGCS